MKVRAALPLGMVAIISLAGCMSAGEHAAAVRQSDADRLTVGTVQREIRVGMSGAEVASVLGSPNVVTTDEERREVWIYDKISTERVYSTSSGGVSILVLGGALIGAGLAGGGIAPSGGSCLRRVRTRRGSADCWPSSDTR